MHRPPPPSVLPPAASHEHEQITLRQLSSGGLAQPQAARGARECKQQPEQRQLGGGGVERNGHRQAQVLVADLDRLDSHPWQHAACKGEQPPAEHGRHAAKLVIHRGRPGPRWRRRRLEGFGVVEPLRLRAERQERSQLTHGCAPCAASSRRSTGGAVSSLTALHAGGRASSGVGRTRSDRSRCRDGRGCSALSSRCFCCTAGRPAGSVRVTSAPASPAAAGAAAASTATGRVRSSVMCFGALQPIAWRGGLACGASETPGLEGHTRRGEQPGAVAGGGRRNGRQGGTTDLGRAGVPVCLSIGPPLPTRAPGVADASARCPAVLDIPRRAAAASVFPPPSRKLHGAAFAAWRREVFAGLAFAAVERPTAA
eukprot:scaffold5491_cov117-Isochrysis_galbana.AAC.3